LGEKKINMRVKWQGRQVGAEPAQGHPEWSAKYNLQTKQLN